MSEPFTIGDHYRHDAMNITLEVDWVNEFEIGLFGCGWTWTGTLEEFAEEWRKVA